MHPSNVTFLGEFLCLGQFHPSSRIQVLVKQGASLGKKAKKKTECHGKQPKTAQLPRCQLLNLAQPPLHGFR